MAHYKRGYPRTVRRTAPRLFTTPSSWNIVHHSRPRRARNKELARQIKVGLDPEGAAWPTDKKPHLYYW